MLYVVASYAQIDSLIVNGSDTSFTMVSGEQLTWQFKVPEEATVSGQIWLDVDSNGTIDTSVDVIRFDFSTTDGNGGPSGVPDMDNTVNGRIEFALHLGLAPGEYVIKFAQGGMSVVRSGTVTPVSSPAHSISGHVTPPEGKSPQYLWLQASRSNGDDGVYKADFWEAYTDSLGNYTIYTDADTSGNPWTVRFADGANPYSPSVYVPSSYSITLDGDITGLDFSFSSYAAKVTGTLKDENGNPIPARGVSINNESFNLFRNTVTNDTGYFEIGLLGDELSDTTYRLASYYTVNTDIDMIGVRLVRGIHLGDSLFYNLVSYHVNSSIQGRVLINGNPPGFPITISGGVTDTAGTHTIADSATGNFSLPVSDKLYNYFISPNNWSGSEIYQWGFVYAHPGQTGIIIYITTNGGGGTNQYPVNITSLYGTVVRNPDQSTYDSNTVVQLTATPDHGYRFLRWSGDVSGTDNPMNVTVTGTLYITAEYETDSSYQVLYRSFNPDSIALAKDNFGKVGKSVKNKATLVEFEFALAAPSGANGLHLEFSVPIDTTMPNSLNPPPTTVAPVAKSGMKKWDLTFATEFNTGDTVMMHGYGSKGLIQKISAYWWTNNGSLVGSKLKNPLFTMNQLRLPMPNRINVLDSVFKKAFPLGVDIGVTQANKDSAKMYGWVYLKKSADALKSLSTIGKGVVNLHDGAARGFDILGSGTKMKIFTGKQTSLPPAKQNNELFADLLALKVSIAASALGITPIGFGDLILNDTAQNPWNGLTLRQLAEEADTMMTGYFGHTFENAPTYALLATTVRNILNAFEGRIDTGSFGSALVLNGTNRLLDCEILRAGSSATPYRIIPFAVSAEQPDRYNLYQNYPNPFNPVTRIRYSLPEDGVVTLKVFNVLGQEVATLVNNESLGLGEHEALFDGSSVASGVYFYRLTIQASDASGSAPIYTDVKKMVLVK